MDSKTEIEFAARLAAINAEQWRDPAELYYPLDGYEEQGWLCLGDLPFGTHRRAYELYSLVKELAQAVRQIPWAKVTDELPHYRKKVGVLTELQRTVARELQNYLHEHFPDNEERRLVVGSDHKVYAAEFEDEQPLFVIFRSNSLSAHLHGS